jgi:hypothetical protein
MDKGYEQAIKLEIKMSNNNNKGKHLTLLIIRWTWKLGRLWLGLLFT